MKKKVTVLNSYYAMHARIMLDSEFQKRVFKVVDNNVLIRVLNHSKQEQ